MSAASTTPSLASFAIAYAVPALMLAAVAIAPWLGVNAAGWLPLFVLFVLLPIADALIGLDRSNPPPSDEAALEADARYRWLTFAAVPVHLSVLAVTLVYVHTHAAELSALGWVGWLASQGVVGGVIAINVAHELIHKPGKLEPALGGVLLASVCYAGFKVEHLRGHHVHVSTPLDTSSAPRGMGVYRFLLRALPGNFSAAWRLEAERLARLGLSPWHWRNELLGWYGLSVLFALLAYLTLGPIAALMFVVQGLLAGATLEVINYVEHYGLERRQLPSGRYERTTHLHSWNSSYWLSNRVLFHLQRHSDHHADQRRRYQVLRHFDDSPQLPAGYATMFLLALVPPLWFAVVNSRLRVGSGPDSQVRDGQAT